MDKVISETLGKLHAVTTELRPVTLDDFGLAAAMEYKQVEELRKRSGIDYRVAETSFEQELPRDKATVLFWTAGRT